MTNSQSIGYLINFCALSLKCFYLFFNIGLNLCNCVTSIGQDFSLKLALIILLKPQLLKKSSQEKKKRIIAANTNN